jgi:predicted transcriptional regulator
MVDYRDLTDLHLALLGVLWDRREATIAEIHESLRSRNKVSRKTIATILSRLEKRGFVRHRTAGNEGIYTATVPRRTVVISRMAAVLGAVFEGPVKGPVPHLVERGEVRAGDVDRLRKLLRKAERDIRGDS